MKDVRVGPLLFSTIFVMAALPLVAAFYFLDHALETSLSLGFNARVIDVLTHAGDNLKALRRFDPEQQDEYRRQFREVEELHHVYSNPTLVKANLLRSLRIYFGAGLLGAVVLSVLAGTLLSRRIHRSYQRNFTALVRSQQRVRYLEEVATWQEMAKMLAHEIKNPLTPIEMLLSALLRSFERKPAEEFAEQLRQTHTMIMEEVDHLKATVKRFSEFSKLPQVEPVEVCVGKLLQRQLTAVGQTLQAASWRWARDYPSEARARIDPSLFRQVLSNLMQNGIEANPGRQVQFVAEVSCNADNVMLTLANDGAPVASTVAARMFDPYVSTRASKDNMGLGLAIVRKIIVQHGGEIDHRERDGHPLFTITLPRHRIAAVHP